MNKLVFVTGLLLATSSLTINAETTTDTAEGTLNNQSLDSVVGWVPNADQIKANRLALMRETLAAGEGAVETSGEVSGEASVAISTEEIAAEAAEAVTVSEEAAE